MKFFMVAFFMRYGLVWRLKLKLTFIPVINNNNNSRRGAKTQRKNYYVCVFPRAFASSREKLFLSILTLLAD